MRTKSFFLLSIFGGAILFAENSIAQNDPLASLQQKMESAVNELAGLYEVNRPQVQVLKVNGFEKTLDALAVDVTDALFSTQNLSSEVNETLFSKFGRALDSITISGPLTSQNAPTWKTRLLIEGLQEAFEIMHISKRSTNLEMRKTYAHLAAEALLSAVEGVEHGLQFRRFGIDWTMKKSKKGPLPNHIMPIEKQIKGIETIMAKASETAGQRVDNLLKMDKLVLLSPTIFKQTRTNIVYRERPQRLQERQNKVLRRVMLRTHLNNTPHR